MYVHHVRKSTYTALCRVVERVQVLGAVLTADDPHRATSRAPCSRRRPPLTCTCPGVLAVYLCHFYLLKYILPISTKRGINTTDDNIVQKGITTTDDNIGLLCYVLAQVS